MGAPPNLEIGDWGSGDSHVGDLGRLHRFQNVRERLSGTKKRLRFTVFRIIPRRIMQSDAPKAVFFTQQHRTERGLADAYRVI